MTDEPIREPEEDEPEVHPRVAMLREVPFLPDLYDETYVNLVPAAPGSLYALWEVGRTTREELLRRFGAGFFDSNRLILRIYDVTGVDFNGFNAHTFFEVDDWLNDKRDYWVHAEGGRDFVAELGYRAAGTSFFEKVARSSAVFVPRGIPATGDGARWGHADCDPNSVEIQVEHEGWRWNLYEYWRQRTHAAPPEKGFWSLVLHQHLPFVRHPEYEVSLEEQWFFEAVASVYTQLLAMMYRLERDRVDFRLTVSLTPSLLSMMIDPVLRLRAARHIDELISLATRERDRTVGRPEHDAIQQALGRFWTAKEVWDRLDGDLTRGYRHFQDAGKLEVITCAATHFILPLFKGYPETVRAQVQVASRQYARVFGRVPRGIWLPENAYTPGLDRFLADEGIRWTLCSARTLAEGDARPQFGTSAPIVTPSGVAVFGIDKETGAKIWSKVGGYPGHPNYKEWYRDLGYDLPWEEIPPYFRTADVRRPTGIKTRRVTGGGADLGSKQVYVPAWATETMHQHAGQFVFERGAYANHFLGQHGRRSMVVSAYDAELYGHWWEEGPAFLESVFRKMLFDQSEVRLVTPSAYLAEEHHHQALTPGAGSWGKHDFFATWVDGRAFQPNCWVWRHYFRLAGRMSEAATRFVSTTDDLTRRALNQAAREFFLAGASDWGFLIETGQAVRYSELQIVTHLDRAKELLRQAENGSVDPEYLSTMEQADTIFPWQDMDFRVFAR